MSTSMYVSSLSLFILSREIPYRDLSMSLLSSIYYLFLSVLYLYIKCVIRAYGLRSSVQGNRPYFYSQL